MNRLRTWRAEAGHEAYTGGVLRGAIDEQLQLLPQLRQKGAQRA